MKKLNVQILKKNRKYFDIRLENGRERKLLIDDASRALPLGSATIDCEEISIRTKWGAVVVFKMRGKQLTAAQIRREEKLLVQKNKMLTLVDHLGANVGTIRRDVDGFLNIQIREKTFFKIILK